MFANQNNYPYFCVIVGEVSRQVSTDDIRARINECGLKATPQRMRVYAVMCRLGHASADRVYQELGGARGKMTLATVYNVLESMTEVGLLVRRPSFSSKMYFDVNTSEHGHLYRQDTQEIVDFSDEPLLQSVEARRKYEPSFTSATTNATIANEAAVGFRSRELFLASGTETRAAK